MDQFSGRKGNDSDKKGQNDDSNNNKKDHKKDSNIDKKEELRRKHIISSDIKEDQTESTSINVSEATSAYAAKAVGKMIEKQVQDHSKKEEAHSSDDENSQVAKYRKIGDEEKLAIHQKSSDTSSSSDKSTDSVTPEKLKKQIEENAEKLVKLRDEANQQLERSFDMDLFNKIDETNAVIEKLSEIKKEANKNNSQLLMDYVKEQDKHLKELNLGGSQQQKEPDYSQFFQQISSDDKASDANSETQKNEDVDWKHGELIDLVGRTEPLLGEDHQLIKDAEKVLKDHKKVMGDLYKIQDKDQRIKSMDDLIDRHVKASDALRREFKKLTGMWPEEASIDPGIPKVDKQPKTYDTERKEAIKQSIELHKQELQEAERRNKLQGPLQQQVDTAQTHLDNFTIYQRDNNAIWLAALQARNTDQQGFDQIRTNTENLLQTARNRLNSNAQNVNQQLSDSTTLLGSSNNELQAIENAMQNQFSTEAGGRAGKKKL